LNVLVGKLIPDTGSVTFQGQSVLGRTPFQINQLGISRVFQTPEIFTDLSVIENMLIPCFAKRDGSFRMHAVESIESEKSIIEKAEAMLEEVNMAPKRDMIAGSLSRGDKRRLEMAMCLVQEPKLLLLDEPTAGMARADTNNTIDLLKQIHVARHHHGHHRTRHARGVLPRPADHRSRQGTPLVEDIPENIKGHPKVKEAYLGESA
jgi:branched-chain amino acid transport system ATP-binding protein